MSKYRWNEEKDLIIISKKEAFKLREDGYGEFVKKSFNKKHPTYYCVEEKENIYRYDKALRKKVLVRLSALNKLEEYRKSCTAS